MAKRHALGSSVQPIRMQLISAYCYTLGEMRTVQSVQFFNNDKNFGECWWDLYYYSIPCGLVTCMAMHYLYILYIMSSIISLFTILYCILLYYSMYCVIIWYILYYSLLCYLYYQYYIILYYIMLHFIVGCNLL